MTINIRPFIYQKVKSSSMLIILLMLTLTLAQFNSKVQECIQYKKAACIQCPINTHLKQSQCYKNIYGCLQYKYLSQLAICKQCNLTISIPQDNISCRRIGSNSNFSLVSSQQYRIIIDLSLNDYVFRQLLLKDLVNDTYFQKCNNFMRTGQYRHFISRGGDPVFSVFSYSSKGFKQYKILYQGSGGSLLMCLIAISQDSNTIILRSFVTIGRTQIIDNCVDYSAKLECSRCKMDYHLDVDTFNQKVCYLNIPGCVQYYRNICIKCRGNQLIIENRCVASCLYFKDTRSIKFYRYSVITKPKLSSNIVQRKYFEQIMKIK